MVRSMVANTSAYDRGVRSSGLSETHKYILGQVPAESTILELGPATGYMTRQFVEKRCVVDAIEVNPGDADIARPYCRTMIVASAEDPSVFDRLKDKYDVVVMADVLEHLRSPEIVLKNVHGLLRPSGFVLVSLPNVAHWRMRLLLLSGKFEYTETDLCDRTHLRFYTRKTGLELLQNAGYGKVQIVVPPAPRSRIRALHGLIRQALPTLFTVNFIYHARARG